MQLPTINTNTITHSRLESAACPRRHQFRYELGIVPADTAKPLRFGGAYHLALDLFAKGASDETVVEAINDHYADYEPQRVDVERETVTRLAFAHRWRWQDCGDEVIASELAFSLPLKNPSSGAASTLWTLAGKIDAIVKLSDGRLAVKEYKTTQAGESMSPESDYWKRLRIDSQISIYMLAARSLGHDVQTVIYDVTGRPTIAPKQIPVLDANGCKVVIDANGERVFKKDGKPRKSASSADGYVLQSRVESAAEFGERLTTDIGERPDWYFARQEIPRLDSDLAELQTDLWSQAAMLRDCRREARWPRRTSLCIGFGRCPYLDLCSYSTPDALVDVPSGFVRLDDVCPELTNT